MKIYDRTAFSFGLCCACLLPVYALGLVDASWWQWGFTAAVAARYLYAALSKAASGKADEKRFNKTAVRLYGKHALVKVDLPGILLGVFLCGAVFAYIAFDAVTPAWACGIFCVLLVLSAAYSLGLEKKIKDAISSEDAHEKSAGDR